MYFDSLALSLEHMYQITKTEPKLIRAFKGLNVEMPHVRVQKNLANEGIVDSIVRSGPCSMSIPTLSTTVF